MARFERGPRREYGEWDEMEFDYGWDYERRPGRRRSRGERGAYGPPPEFGAERGYGTRTGYGELGYGNGGYIDEPGYDLDADYGPRMDRGYEGIDDYDYGGRGWPYRAGGPRRGAAHYGRGMRRYGRSGYEPGYQRPGYLGTRGPTERFRRPFGADYSAEYGGGYPGYGGYERGYGTEYSTFGEAYGPEYGRGYRGGPGREFSGWYGGDYSSEPRERGWRGEAETEWRGELGGPEELYRRPTGRRGQAMLGVMGGVMDRMEGRPGHTPPDRWPEEGHDVADRPLRELEMHDGEIREAVLENLFQDSWVDPQLIDVDVTEGVVTLSGEVNDFMEARYAWDDAWESAGVRGVVNHLTVRADQPQERMELPQTSGGEDAER